MNEVDVERTNVIGESIRRSCEKWESIKTMEPPVKHSVSLDPSYRKIWMAVADDRERALNEFRKQNEGDDPTLHQLLKARVNWNGQQIVNILGRRPSKSEIKSITEDIAEMIAHGLPRAQIESNSVTAQKERLEMQMEAIRRDLTPLPPAKGPSPPLVECQLPNSLDFKSQLHFINRTYGNQEIDVDFMASLFA